MQLVQIVMAVISQWNLSGWLALVGLLRSKTQSISWHVDPATLDSKLLETHSHPYPCQHCDHTWLGLDMKNCFSDVLSTRWSGLRKQSVLCQVLENSLQRGLRIKMSHHLCPCGCICWWDLPQSCYLWGCPPRYKLYISYILSLNSKGILANTLNFNVFARLLLLFKLQKHLGSSY